MNPPFECDYPTLLNSIPELRKYDKAYRAAQKELKKRPVVPVRALESISQLMKSSD
jgi:hypothetical protein